MDFLTNILSRLLLAIVPSIIWTLLSFVITYGLYHIKGKDLPSEYTDIFTYICVANYILITIVLIFFIKENIPLF